jgi:hypothetical protein
MYSQKNDYGERAARNVFCSVRGGTPSPKMGTPSNARDNLRADR